MYFLERHSIRKNAMKLAVFIYIDIFENLLFFRKMCIFSNMFIKILVRPSLFFMYLQFCSQKAIPRMQESHIFIWENIFSCRIFYIYCVCLKKLFFHFIVNNLVVFPAGKYLNYIVSLSFQRQHDLFDQFQYNRQNLAFLL